jgi:hypothetical protein
VEPPTVLCLMSQTCSSRKERICARHCSSSGELHYTETYHSTLYKYGDTSVLKTHYRNISVRDNNTGTPCTWQHITGTSVYLITHYRDTSALKTCYRDTGVPDNMLQWDQSNWHHTQGTPIYLTHYRYIIEPDSTHSLFAHTMLLFKFALSVGPHIPV